jgi:flagellar assembly protein FliH
MEIVFKACNASQAAVFGDIRHVAREERSRILGYEPDMEVAADIREQAEQILSHAREKAEAIREEAHSAGYSAGYDSGRAAGTASARAQADEERAQYRAEIEQFVEQIELERQRIWTEAEPQILSFALELARRVVKQDAEINRDIALSVVRNALRRVVDTENIRIRVNGADLQNIRAAREDLLALVDGMRHFEIIDDRRVSPGGCVVETNAGTIDAKLETQFSELEHTLLEMVGEAA